MDVLARARRLLRPVHPAVWRQRWSWRDLRLNPSDLALPIAPPGARDFIVTGCPRTGTSLAAAALFQPPTCITVVEPWAGMRLPPQALFEHVRSTRGDIRIGTLDFAALMEKQRVVRCPEGTSTVNVAYDDETLMGIKWPSFVQYLPLLPNTRFVVCLRHPFEVIASMAAQGGGLREGQDYALPFNRRMNQAIRHRTNVPALRRIELFDYVHERILPYLEAPNVFVLRYERWWSDPQRLLSEVGAFLGADLSQPNVQVAQRGEVRLSSAERALITRHSRTAHRLGYTLD